MKLKRDTKFGEDSTCRFKIDKRNLKNFKAKYILFDLQKCRGVIFHETEEGYEIWRGIDLLF